MERGHTKPIGQYQVLQVTGNLTSEIWSWKQGVGTREGIEITERGDLIVGEIAMGRGQISSVPVDVGIVHIHENPIDDGTVHIHGSPVNVGTVHGSM